MSSFPRRLILVALVTFVLAPATAHAAGMAPGSDLSSPFRRFVPDRPLHGRGRDAAHGRARGPAQAQLRRPPVGLPRHRRHQHARRLQPAAAALDPVHGRDRRGQRQERNVFFVRLCDGDVIGNQPGRVGAGDEHAPRGVRRAARPAHAVRARRHGRGARTPPATRSRPRSFRQDLNFGHDQGRCRQGLPQGADRGARSLLPQASTRSGGRASSRRRARRRCSRRSGPDQGVDAGAGRASCSATG